MNERSNANGKTPSDKTLGDWRQEIDTLDAEILRLLNQRARIACELGAIKVASGLPAYDGRREQQVLDRVCAGNQGPLSGESVTRIFRSIIRESRRIGMKSMKEQRSRKETRVSAISE
jgi:chorismate mutase-like protein